MSRIPVVVLGATGSVGQKFCSLLHNHPWFEVKALAASSRSSGKRYREAVNWVLPSPIPPEWENLIVASLEPPLAVPLAFSALDASVAGDMELAYAKAGVTVVSNARNHRLTQDVPLLIPEINPDHLNLLEVQNYGSGKIVTNPNCSTIGLALALKPLHDLFEIAQVHVVTFQAISGAGYPGVASLDILDNVIPFIGGEEQKMEMELLKILGTYSHGKVNLAPIRVSAQCNRVPVSDGHLECVSVKFKTKPAIKEVIEAWKTFKAKPQELNLPLAPIKPIHYFEEENFPQPKLHRHLDKGMAVSIGRLRECPLFDYKFVLLSHNTVRGAAGGAILSAELIHFKL